jgi:hypothetical protein
MAPYGLSCSAVSWKINIVYSSLFSEPLRKTVLFYQENGITIFHRNIGSKYWHKIAKPKLLPFYFVVCLGSLSFGDKMPAADVGCRLLRCKTGYISSPKPSRYTLAEREL